MQSCGEKRWAEIPLPFARRLKSIVNSLPRSGDAAENTQLPPPAHLRDSYELHTRSQPSDGRQGHQGQASSSSANAPQPGLGWFGPRSVDPNTPNKRILFMVKSGVDYKLAQISVDGLTCHVFFSALREKYFHLRGFLRGWFSVWRYSHCDFYMARIQMLYLPWIPYFPLLDHMYL